MFEIRNRSDLALAYILLNDRQIYPRKNAAKNAERIIELKRAIRAYVHKPLCEEILVKDYGMDGYVVRFPLPEDLESLEEAREYFKECYFIEPYYTYYDCTGRPFTSWYKVYQHNGRFWAYHSVSYDV